MTGQTHATLAGGLRLSGGGASSNGIAVTVDDITASARSWLK